jgi:erythromycin esterase-like protein
MNAAVGVVRESALWFEPTAEGFAPLLDAVGNARLVLIGDATHGTHEFYRTRAELTAVHIDLGPLALARRASAWWPGEV